MRNSILPMPTLIAGLALAASIIWPSSSMAQCNSNCAVGAFGTGGESSDGAAQGFLYIGPAHVEGFSAFNSGNFDAGHEVIVLDSDGNVIGVIDGTLRDGVCRGLQSGIFGDGHGLDPDCF